MLRYEGTPRGRMGVNIGQIHDDQSCNTLGRCVFVRVFSPRCWQCDHQYCTRWTCLVYMWRIPIRISYVYTDLLCTIASWAGGILRSSNQKKADQMVKVLILHMQTITIYCSSKNPSKVRACSAIIPKSTECGISN